MPDVLEEEVKKRVDEIEKKVSESQGQIALSARKIVTGKNVCCAAGTSYDYFYYTEAGIISGELEKLEQKNLSNMCEIDITPLIWTPHGFHTYYYHPDFMIPVQRKLFSVRLCPEDLKKATKGEIRFGREELEGRPDIFGYQKTVPYLENFDISIGDNEVRRFLQGPELFAESKIEWFFSLLKNPGEIEKVVEEYDFRQREDVARNLVQEIARLKMLEQKVIELEDSVMKATAHFTTDDEGRGKYLEWSSKTVYQYKQLREEIQEHVKKAGGVLKRADELELTKHPAIDGRYVGFPWQVSPKEYISYVREKVVAGVNERLEKINARLRAERERVERE